MPGTATWKLKAGKTLVGKLTRAVGPGKQTIKVRLSAKGKRALKSKRVKRLTLSTTLTEASGRRVSASTPVKLR